jgi:hypothetical protein
VGLLDFGEVGVPLEGVAAEAQRRADLDEVLRGLGVVLAALQFDPTRDEPLIQSEGDKLFLSRHPLRLCG